MNSFFYRLLATWGLLLASSVTWASGSDSCDRSCLRGFADQLISSMIAHDSTRLPLAQEYLATENSAPSTPGLMVVWRTASAVRNRFYVIDPVSEQIFLIGTLSEGSTDALLYGRIKVHKARISELELYTSHSRGQGGFQFSADGAANFPKAWTDVIAPERRSSRAELLQAGHVPAHQPGKRRHHDQGRGADVSDVRQCCRAAFAKRRRSDQIRPDHRIRS